jgi:hypothetical protein
MQWDVFSIETNPNFTIAMIDNVIYHDTLK